MRVLVCGSREWADRNAIAARLAELPDDSIVIHGGARGADTIAGQEAALLRFHSAVMHPLWVLGNGAGHVRNAAMLDLEPQLVLAFSLGTNGTQGTIDEARRRGIPVEVVGTEKQEAA